MNNTTKTTALAAALLLTTAQSQCFAQDSSAALREAGKALQAGIPDAAMPEAVKKSMRAMEAQLQKIERRVAGMIPVPNLTLDTRGRKVGLRLIGRRNVDLDTSYRVGDSEPMVQLALRADGNGPRIQAETSAAGDRGAVSGSWTRARWTLSGGLSKKSSAKRSHDISLSYRLNAQQTLEVSERGGDRRVSWTYTLKFKS